jgi:phosphoglycolate phosphatase
VSFTVGFDLDMTLIDPRPGMVALFEALSAETGHPLDGAAFASRLGPPLVVELGRYGFDEPTVEDLVTRFRARYCEIVIPLTVALPGAAEAIETVREHGGRSLVVTAKNEPHARVHLERLGLVVDDVVGSVFGAEKSAALRAAGAEVYVGDHLGDINGARGADAMAVGVATGPISGEDLASAGADVVLGDLTAFPAWLSSYLLATVH